MEASLTEIATLVLCTADLIQKLINRNKRILAVKFIFQFGLTDEFQPIALLKTHLKVIKKFAKKVCMDEKTSVKERVILHALDFQDNFLHIQLSLHNKALNFSCILSKHQQQQ